MKLPFTEGHYVFEGIVSHERFIPKTHRFNYKLFYLLVDLDKINELDSLSPFWSVNKTNLVQFKRNDYMRESTSTLTSTKSEDDLKAAVIDVIFDQAKENFSGKVFLLSNLRYWGYCFNPVSYYFCFNEKGDLQYVVDEVTNTPWKERHHYVHKVINSTIQNVAHTTPESSSQGNNNKVSRRLMFEFEKTFHVSPFMPMDMFYKTSYVLDNNKILIHMDLYNNSEREDSSRETNKMKKTFFATMNLHGKPLTKTTATLLPFRFPFQCSKIIVSIYWQALKLWIKRVPFFAHPQQ